MQMKGRMIGRLLSLMDCCKDHVLITEELSGTAQ